MGCIANIDFDNYPKQRGSEAYTHVGARVEVCYHFDPHRTHTGAIVRDDAEEPFETIIKLDNGRYLRATECQYRLADEGAEMTQEGGSKVECGS